MSFSSFSCVGNVLMVTLRYSNNIHMKNIRDKMNLLCPTSENTIQVLEKYVTFMHFPKKYRLIEANKYNGYAYFMEKGKTRAFWVVGNNEITTSFADAGGIVFSMDELYYGKDSEEFVETLEEADAYRISIADLNHLFNSNMELCNWGRIIHQNEYRRIHRSHKERLTLPVLDRYKEFEKQFPGISNTVNLGHIASYLGTTLPTLSRVRAIIAKTQL